MRAGGVHRRRRHRRTPGARRRAAGRHRPPRTADAVRTLVTDRHFLACPRVSPDGSQARLDRLGPPADAVGRAPSCGSPRSGATASLGRPRTVAGRPRGVGRPGRLGADGTLLFVSDRRGWWNLHRVDAATGRGRRPLRPRRRSSAGRCGRSATAGSRPLDDGLIAGRSTAGGATALGVLDPATGELVDDADPGPSGRGRPRRHGRPGRRRRRRARAAPTRSSSWTPAPAHPGSSAPRTDGTVDPAYYLPEPQMAAPSPGPAGARSTPTSTRRTTPTTRPDAGRRRRTWCGSTAARPAAAPLVLDLEIAYFTTRGHRGRRGQLRRLDRLRPRLPRAAARAVGRRRRRGLRGRRARAGRRGHRRPAPGWRSAAAAPAAGPPRAALIADRRLRLRHDPLPDPGPDRLGHRRDPRLRVAVPGEPGRPAGRRPERYLRALAGPPRRPDQPRRSCCSRGWTTSSARPRSASGSSSGSPGAASRTPISTFEGEGHGFRRAETMVAAWRPNSPSTPRSSGSSPPGDPDAGAHVMSAVPLTRPPRLRPGDRVAVRRRPAARGPEDRLERRLRRAARAGTSTPIAAPHVLDGTP